MHWIDPLHLPETKGQVSTILYNSHGDCDGFLLENKLQIHVPPHLSARLLKKVKAGDQISVRGVRPRGVQLVNAISLTTAKGDTIEDQGPDPMRAPPPTAIGDPREIEVRGQVRQTLYAPRGEVVGALLESGEIVRMHPKGNEALSDYFKPGARIVVIGDRIMVRKQLVVDLGEIGFDEDSAPVRE